MGINIGIKDPINLVPVLKSLNIRYEKNKTPDTRTQLVCSKVDTILITLVPTPHLGA
jgi:hypothetical protein